MTDTVVTLQPAFILQHRQYRETSLILDMFTRDYGIVGVLAKGVRKTKSKSLGLLLPFKALNISYCGKADLKTLTHVELYQDKTDLSGLALYCGFYVNELIFRFCHKHDPHPEAYQDYVDCLQKLHGLACAGVLAATDANLLMQLEIILRIFELNLMQHIGLAPFIQLEAHTETPIKSTARYHFQADQGAIEHAEGLVSGKTLQALNNKDFNDAQTLQEAKHVMRHVINFHLQGKPLKSRAVLSKIYRQFYI